MIQRWRTLSPYWRRTTLRLALLPLILFLLYNIVFFLLEVLYDPLAGYDGNPPLDQTVLDYFHINDSIWEKYVDFWHSVFTFDFGEGFLYPRSIRGRVSARWQASAELLGLSVILGSVLATAIAAASRRTGDMWTAVIRALVATLVAVPLVVVLVEVLVRPADWWDYFPPIGRYEHLTDDPLANLKQFITPALAMGLLGGAWSSRVARRYLPPRADLTPSLLVPPQLSPVQICCRSRCPP